VITHTCKASLAADVTALVEHLAYCPETPPELVSVCRDLIRTAAEGARIETRAVSTETPTETREMTPSDMTAMRDTGATYREIGDRAGVAPETVRRRINKWKAANGL
jgi:DNA-directed RNA polymerase specialized sigma24 family protein